MMGSLHPQITQPIRLLLAYVTGAEFEEIRYEQSDADGEGLWGWMGACGMCLLVLPPQVGSR